MADNNEQIGGDGQQVDSQAQQQTGTRQVALRVDERDMTSSYANAFRTNGSAEEVFVDFGLNLIQPAPPAEGSEEPSQQVLFKVNDRVILNYYTAKRLAITLGQIIRQHEERFGELKLNVGERTANPEK